MLTTQHQLLLRSAARSDRDVIDKEIDKTLTLIKAINPSAFHNRDSLKLRKFFDEPTTLAPEDYAVHIVHYNQHKQHDMFKRRDALLLKSVEKKR